MKTKIIFIILTIFILFACTKIGTEADGNSIVSGTVYYNSEPILNATIRLSNENRYETILLTDENGFFEFLNVPNGEYELSYSKTFENGCFVERNNEITIEGNCNFDNLLLPDAVSMYEPTNTTSESLDLSWSPSNALDFREYKIYRALTSGLDEITGLLVHVSTIISDTTFTDEDLNPYETYYYRVYVMNDYGRLGGSNIVYATTENQNVILNGSFEIIDPETSFAEDWDLFLANNIPTYFVDSLVVFDGSYSVNMTSGDDHVMDYELYQNIAPSKLVTGARYQLSFWMKNDTVIEQNTFGIYFREETTNTVLLDEGPQNNMAISDWTQFVYEFTVPNIPNATNYKLRIGFCLWHHTYLAWFDKVEIIRID